MAGAQLTGCNFGGMWNYEIRYIHWKTVKDSMLVHLLTIDLIWFEGEEQEGSALSDDENLKKELARHGIGALYSKLHNAQVDVNILWSLDDELIKLCNLTPIEKLKYETAKGKRSGDW